jgi:hypothetical protein
MANSKSSIYPIQLKNAELNLNKYDAEIKQYTGFNKNNAPFVGGCLSNLFTKDEVITDSDDSNVYINSDGDIYKVDEEGIYVNEKKVKSFPSGTKFYKQEKIQLKDIDIIKLYNENVYIYRSEGYLKYHCNQVDNNLIDLNSIDEPKCDIVNYKTKYIFTAKKVNYMVYNGVITITDTVNIIIIENDNIVFQQSYTYNLNMLGNAYYCGCGVYCFDEGCIFSPNIVKTSSPIDYKFISFSDYSVTTIPDLIDTPEQKWMANKLGYYIMTNDGHFYIAWAPGGSKSYPNQNITYNALTAGYFNYNNGVIVNPLSGLSLSSESVTYATRGFLGVYNSRFFSGAYRFTANGVSRCAAYASIYNFHNVNYFTFTGKDVIGNCYINTGSYCKLGNFKVLIYDNQVIGISVIDKTTDILNEGFCGVLLTDWNSVDGDTIILIDDDTIIYKNINDNCFYRIKLSIPELMIKYNQVVVNAAICENSIDIKKNKFLCFAFDWNCTYFSNEFVTHEPSENAVFIASAVNEYDLKDNASILLNQQPVYRIVGNSNLSIYDLNLNVGKNPVSAVINVYIDSIDNVNAKYFTSIKSGAIFYNNNLEGLPFPNTTDGNVLYSPSLFSEFYSNLNSDVFIKCNNNTYQLSKQGNEAVMSYYLGTLIENFDYVFIIQGQYYGIMNNQICIVAFNNGVLVNVNNIVSVEGLQFCGNTPYQAIFFSKTNRCLYAFTGANVLNVMQTIDKISEVRDYKYNPATQSIFLITDTGVIINGLFGTYQIDYLNITKIFLLNNGFVLNDGSTAYRYIKYYKEEDDGYTKQNIELDTCFYGMDNQTVTINDCLYLRLFSEEHEEGSLEVSAVTLSLKGRKTEKTTFKIKAGDWDKETHTIYLRYQPKEQRGLGISFKINSPFKIASMSVGSQPDAILIDKVSKGAINAPLSTSSNINW